VQNWYIQTSAKTYVWLGVFLKCPLTIPGFDQLADTALVKRKWKLKPY